MRHNINASSSIKLFGKNVTINPAYRLSSLWYLDQVNKNWNEQINEVVNDTVKGFSQIYSQNNDLVFNTSGGEAMRISGGDLLIGTTDVDLGHTDGDSGFAANQAGYFQAARDSANAILYLNKLNNNGTIIQMHKDGTQVGNIGVEASDNFYIADAATNTGINFKGWINPCDSSGASSRDNFDLGHATQGRLRDLYLGGGVFLGGTGSANKLEDYEEGNWTPQLEDASGNDCTQSGQTGQYTKIGNLVYVQFAIGLSGKSGVGNALQISGLPFAVENVSHGSGEPSGGLITYLTGLTTGNYGLIMARANNASSFLELKYTGSSYSTYGGSALNATDIGASTYMAGSCMYRT